MTLGNGDSGLVGRAGELGAIDAAIADAVAGSAPVLALVGEAGLGKRALLAATRERAAGAGLTVLEGRAAEHERDVPFGLVTDALDDTVDYGAICRLVADAVDGGAPQLLERLAADVADVVLGADERISAVQVWVRKLRPPVPQDLATSGVRLRRQRSAGRRADGSS